MLHRVCDNQYNKSNEANNNDRFEGMFCNHSCAVKVSNIEVCSCVSSMSIIFNSTCKREIVEFSEVVGFSEPKSVFVENETLYVSNHLVDNWSFWISLTGDCCKWERIAGVSYYTETLQKIYSDVVMMQSTNVAQASAIGVWARRLQN